MLEGGGMKTLDIEKMEGHVVTDVLVRSNRVTIETDKGVFLLMHKDGDNGPARVAAVFQDKACVVGKEVERAGRYFSHITPQWYCSPIHTERFMWTRVEIHFGYGFRLVIWFLAESDVPADLEVRCYGVLYA
jgi:hypothetical protein